MGWGPLTINYSHINTPVETATQQATLGDIQAQADQRRQLVTENALKLQQQQRDQQDQQNLTNHIRNVTAAGGTRQQALDTMDTVGGVSATGAAKYRDLDAQFKERAASTDKTTLGNQLTQYNAVSGDLLPIRTMQDPGMKAAQWATARQNAIAKGYIKPDDPFVPPTYPGDQAYEAAMSHLQGAKEYAEYGINAQKAADEHVKATNDAALAPSHLQTAQTAAASGQTKAAGAELAAADSQPAWDTILAKYPGSGQQFGAVYSPDAAKRAGNFTITPEQRNQADSTQLYRDQLEEARKERIAKLTDNELYMKATDPTDPDSQHARRALDLKEQERLSGSKTGAGGTSLRPFITQEGKLNSYRSSLGTAIATGKVFVDKNGAMKPIASLGDSDAQSAAIEDMKNRFQDVTNELKGVIEDKNNAISKYGGTPSVSTEQAHAALDAGTQKLFNPQAAAKGGPPPAAPKPAAPAPKPSFTAGQSVRLKSGKTVRVTKVYPNGSFDYE